MRIAILGAECTGKSTLAKALQPLIAQRHGDTQVIPEYLRAWCEANDRTPTADEQWHIARHQAEAMQTASRFQHTLSDTSALMTAVYSDIYFDDTSLYDYAVSMQREFDCTLVMGLDLQWVEDGIQRDSETMRTRCDATLRRVLQQHRIAFTSIYGTQEERTTSAMQTISHALGSPMTIPKSNWQWNCEKCSDADCEHKLFSKLVL